MTSSSSPHPALAPFHPLVQAWFSEAVGRPTDIQIQAWPRIRAGEHLLMTAPTGSGKTLTAFLSVLDRFLTRELAGGATRVLYISPLKALGSDIERNLLQPLAELKQRFAAKGSAMPEIQVATRSGDTLPGARQKMLRRPPEILITTPESINLLLSSAGGQSILQALDTVILDEIHAVVETRRGAHLITAVERLTRLSGEFQRLALSASVRPLPLVAEFVGGYRFDGRSYQPRKLGIISSSSQKDYDLTVCRLQKQQTEDPEHSGWDALAETLLPRIRKNRSTLIFANTRATAERLTLSINRAAGETLAWVHHGSLAREVRKEVELRLKSGQLAAIVATSSLEMGIDIGTLDEVILVQTPFSISSALQRVGRAGHQVGAVSRGRFFPLDAMDLLQSGVAAKGIVEGAIEAAKPIKCPLDLLAQLLVSMTSLGPRRADDLLQELRCSWTYHELGDEQFQEVLEMLTGCFAGKRLEGLPGRISTDPLDNLIQARRGAVHALYFSGGTIPDRGYYQLRHAETDARIGELDEEFVWEARVGQIFSFGTRQWQITGITQSDVRVRPKAGRSSAPPFWIAESVNRSFHFSERLGRLLEDAESMLAAGERKSLVELLQTDCHLEAAAALEAADFLAEQRSHTRSPLPHRRQLLLESVSSAAGRDGGSQLLLHNFWGGRVNRPFALALQAAWQNQFQHRLEIFPADDCTVLQLPEAISPQRLLSLVTPENLHQLLRQRLEGSSFYGARFRESAGRALLLSKGRFNQRKPLWMSRQEAQKLAESTRNPGGFPIHLEAWRSCLQDEFDLAALMQLLSELRDGSIQVAACTTASPSPMAKAVAWEQIQKYMYEDDAAPAEADTSLSSQVIAELMGSEAARPAVAPEVARSFQRERQRLTSDYAPRSQLDLLEWVRERLAIPLAQWQLLLEAMGDDAAALVQDCGLRLVSWQGLVLAIDQLLPFARALTGRAPELQEIQPLAAGPDWQNQLAEVLKGLETEAETPPPATLLEQWLRFYGPVCRTEMEAWLPLAGDRLQACLTQLGEAGTLVQGQLLQNDTRQLWCHAACFESLLRRARRLREPGLEPVSLLALPSVVRRLYQQQAQDPELRLELYLDRLQGFPAEASAWEKDLLPAFCPDYDPASLDQLLAASGFCWLGGGPGKLTFSNPEDLDLLAVQKEVAPPEAEPHDMEQLWQQVWQGHIHTRSFTAVRKGIGDGFRAPKNRRRPPPRSPWRGTRPGAGARLGYAGESWQPVPWPEPRPHDLLANEELQRDRARLLMRRYGIVFRDLLKREAAGFRWADIFRALRYMEFAGEVVAGVFYQELDGLQFALPEAAALLQQKKPAGEVFWISAGDPFSPSGLGSQLGRRHQLPRRAGGNYLVYHGEQLTATLQKHGSRVQFLVPPNDPNLPLYLLAHQHLMHRKTAPAVSIELQTINGEAAAASPYLAAFRSRFDVYSDHRAVTIRRRPEQLTGGPA